MPPHCVPATPPTVTVDTPSAVCMSLDRQLTAVLDVHADVLHAPSASAELAVKSKPPKLSPITVTDDPPLGAEFSNPYDNTAASKDSSPRHVPTNIATVSSRFAFRGPPTAGEMGVTRQLTVVADVQLVVTQEKLFAAAETVAF